MSAASITWWTVGILIAALWTIRVIQAFFGFRSLARLDREPWTSIATASPPNAPSLAVIVPARNEAADIERCLRTLLDSTYPNLRVIAVDDRSSDATAEIMHRVQREHPRGSALHILHIDALPADDAWLGKTHAMWRGASHPNAASCEWLLFTDGDIFFHPDTLTRGIAYAESVRADHLVLFPTMILHSFGETMAIAVFQTLFIFEHRAWKVADPNARDSMGVGAFNLVRRTAYQAIGTYAALKLAILDDMLLGMKIKRAGFSQRVAFGRDLLRLRWAKGAAGVVRGLTKNAFALADFSLWRSLALSLGVGAILLLPYFGALLAPGWAKAPYLFTIVIIWSMYIGMSRETEISPAYMLTHPLGSALFVYTLLRSTLITLARGGVAWRGTLYPLSTIRKMQQY